MLNSLLGEETPFNLVPPAAAPKRKAKTQEEPQAAIPGLGEPEPDTLFSSETTAETP